MIGGLVILGCYWYWLQLIKHPGALSSRGMASWRRLSEILGSKPWIENGSGSFWL